MNYTKIDEVMETLDEVAWVLRYSLLEQAQDAEQRNILLGRVLDGVDLLDQLMDRIQKFEAWLTEDEDDA